jgi:hypothetical protein
VHLQHNSSIILAPILLPPQCNLKPYNVLIGTHARATLRGFKAKPKFDGSNLARVTSSRSFLVCHLLILVLLPVCLSSLQAIANTTPKEPHAMTNPNLDTSQWYHMYLNDNKKSSFIGTNLYTNSGTIGAVFFNNTVDLSAPRQRWQIYPINSTTFVLRSGEGGANAFLGTHFVANEETEGHTRPCMVRGDVADDSVFWHFGSWGDGMFWLENAQNGSAYHVERKANGIMAMSPNVTAPQNLQRWGFEGIEKIDDEAWSSVNVSSASLFCLFLSLSLSLSLWRLVWRVARGISVY